MTSKSLSSLSFAPRLIKFAFDDVAFTLDFELGHRFIVSFLVVLFDGVSNRPNVVFGESRTQFIIELLVIELVTEHPKPA